MQKLIYLLFAGIVAALALTACADEKKAAPEENLSLVPQGYETRVLHARKEKDKFFGGSAQSPIPDSLRDDFGGLNYYPVSEDYYIEASVRKFDNPDTVEILTTKESDIRKMLKFAELDFAVGGDSMRLIAYMPAGSEQYLFLPFTDETSGSETYEGGRYIDIECKSGSDKIIIDFNQAYSPFCAYNKRYSCPLVPRENHLPVDIRAGEKILKLK
jgi:hypothetical protein